MKMAICNINHGGPIPFIGRGPFMNKAIPKDIYTILKSQSYDIVLLDEFDTNAVEPEVVAVDTSPKEYVSPVIAEEKKEPNYEEMSNEELEALEGVQIRTSEKNGNSYKIYNIHGKKIIRKIEEPVVTEE